MINCSYFSTNNLIFSSNNDIIQFQKTHIVFFETEHSLQKKQLPRTKNQEPKDWGIGIGIGIGIVFSLFSYLIYSRINEKVYTNDKTICLISILVIHSFINYWL